MSYYSLSYWGVLGFTPAVVACVAAVIWLLWYIFGSYEFRQYSKDNYSKILLIWAGVEVVLLIFIYMGIIPEHIW